MIAVRKSDGGDVYRELRSLNPDAFVAKGMADAYIGHSFGDRPIAIYDYEECVEIMMDATSSSRAEAEQLLRDSTIPDAVGGNLPVFVVVKT